MIIINGKAYSGTSVSIIGGQVLIDGKPQDGTVSGVVEVHITDGVPVSVRSDAAIRCGDVAGDVSAGMEVTCGPVAGSVRAGMSVTCEDVGGDVAAGMGVSMRRR